MMDNLESNRSKRFVWLVARQKLPTCDRLVSWGMQLPTTYVLCKRADESHQHLFIDCAWTAELWKVLFAKFQYQLPSSLEEEILVVSKLCKKGKEVGRLFALVWSEFVQEVWLERCKTLFQHANPNFEIVNNNILFRASTRCKSHMIDWLLF